MSPYLPTQCPRCGSMSIVMRAYPKVPLSDAHVVLQMKCESKDCKHEWDTNVEVQT